MIAAFKYGLHYFNTLQFDTLKVSDSKTPAVTLHADQALTITTDYTITVTGNDSAGNILIDFKNAKTPTVGNLCTVTFNKSFEHEPYVFLSNASEAYCVFSTFDCETSYFIIKLSAGTLTANMNISLSYLCIEPA